VLDYRSEVLNNTAADEPDTEEIYPILDKFICGTQPLEMKNNLKCLGLIFEVTGTTFTKSEDEGSFGDIRATFGIRKPSALPLMTNLAFFKLKISQIIGRVVEITWRDNHL
jgi:hypothetical protein